MTAVRVECHSGYKADERPLRFFLNDHAYEIISIDDQWYSPGASFFRVRASDGNLYILRRDESPGEGRDESLGDSHEESLGVRHNESVGESHDRWSLAAYRSGEHPDA